MWNFEFVSDLSLKMKLARIKSKCTVIIYSDKRLVHVCFINILWCIDLLPFVKAQEKAVVSIDVKNDFNFLWLLLA